MITNWLFESKYVYLLSLMSLQAYVLLKIASIVTDFQQRPPFENRDEDSCFVCNISKELTGHVSSLSLMKVYIILLWTLSSSMRQWNSKNHATIHIFSVSFRKTCYKFRRYSVICVSWNIRNTSVNKKQQVCKRLQICYDWISRLLFNGS
jgi:hypothetical protein